MLEVEDLHGGYGEGDVLRGVSMCVERGEIVTVAGTNGSGKSTLGKALVGLLPRWRGRVHLDGRNLGDVPAHDRLARGVFHVPQVANVFPSLTVCENLQVVRGTKFARREAAVLEQFPALVARLGNRAGTLSGGERQQLAMARALMSSAHLLILDEPTANLAPAVVDEVLELIRQLPDRGVSVLLIEQRAREALAISHRGYVMHLGEVVAEGKAGVLQADRKLGELFFGGVEGLSDEARSETTA